MSFWGEPDTLVTWCEEKYAVSPYISEFHNMWTNIIYLIVPIFIKNFRLNVYILTMGVGSILFHGTSRYYFQLLDEIPMILVTTEFFNMYHNRTPLTRKWWFYTLLYFSSMIGMIFYVFVGFYNLFITIFTCHVLMLQTVGFEATRYLPVARNNYYKAFVCMGVGKLAWEIEQRYCDKNPDLYVLHGLWHFLSGMSIYLLYLSIRSLD
jgi:dihydroceramidase